MAPSPDTTPSDDPSLARTAGLRRRWWLVGGLLAVALATLTLCGIVALGGAWLLRFTSQTAQPVSAPAAALPESRLQPAGSGVNRIAFTTVDGRLGTVDPNGEQLRMLTVPDQFLQFPAWSSDGAHIAAIANDGEAGRVVVMPDSDDASPTVLYSSSQRRPFYLYWSPDDQQVSFLANDPAGIALYLTPADGSAKSRLLTTGQPFYWDWTSMGDQLLIHTGGAGDAAQLAFIDTQGRPMGNPLAEPGFFQAPGISPSGRYFGFAAVEGGESQVVVQRAADAARITVPHKGLAALSWGPTTDQLAFTSPTLDQMTFTGPLRLVDAESGHVRLLVDTTVVSFFWSPDGRSIAYLTRDDALDAPRAGRLAGLAREVLGEAAQDHPPLRLRLSVVDVASGAQRSLAAFQPTELFLTQFIPFFDQYALSHRLWSPASDALVLPMTDGTGRDGIYVIPVDGSSSRRIAEGSMAFWSRN